MRRSNLSKNNAVLILAGVLAFAGAAWAADPAPKKDKDPEISFRHDVMPVFFRAGCNSGGCHGAARGKDGFRLSLFGYDPAGDYFRLTQQMVGRRINLAAPAESLLLQKATGKVPHTGGELFKPDTDYYKTLLRWIEAGAPDDTETIPEAVDIALLPDKIVFDGAVRTKQMQVVATYSDGSKRDVTKLALFMTNNKTAADINENGLVTAGRRGATDVFARFNKFTIGAEIIVLPLKDKFAWPKSIKPVNYIDELIHAKLQKLRIVPSEECTDEQFLRRIYLDMTGAPPSLEEYKKFMADTGADKRDKLIDEMLNRPEYADIWAARWGEWLKIRSDNTPQFGNDRKSALLYYGWVHEQFRNNTPLDRFVHTQLASKGSTFEAPESNFYVMVPAGNFDAKAVAQDVAQLFTGIRINCAECHNHPFDRWTQDDYYSFVSFFTGVKRKTATDPREFYVYSDAGAPLAKHLLDGRPMTPRPLGGTDVDAAGKDPRLILADWVTSPDNKYFAKSMANRIWMHFFGRGVVEPVDDLRITNPPSNRDLYDELGKRLIAYKFDQKKLIRDILMSRTYNLSAKVNETNDEDDRQFSRATVRRLRADVALDSLTMATGVQTRFSNFPAGYRAMQIYEGGQKFGNYFLQAFGQSERRTVCACDDRTEPTFAQTLHLINGDTVRTKLSGSKVVEQLLKDKKTPAEIIEELFIRALTRKPSAEEVKTIQEMLAANPAPRKAYDNLFWALLNSTEFLFSY